jgi:ribosomal protein S28E/S33
MRYARVLVGLLCVTGALLPTSAFAQEGDKKTPHTRPVNYTNVIHITPRKGVKGDLAPIVRIVSPLADSRVAPGEGSVGAGSPNGTGFVVTLEIVTRDKTTVSLQEATNIRRVDLLNAGALNPNAPGLYFFFDVDLITPDGSVLPKFNNFASAFNIAGTDDTPGDGVTAWLGWHVLESVPEDVDEFTMTAAFVDDAGRIGLDRITLKVDRSKSSGQALTPEPLALIGTEGVPGAPEVTLIAPRVPTSIALGAQDNTLNATNGALFFIQVSAVAQGDAEIAVSENGNRQGVVNPAIGLIADGSQIPNPTTGATGGPNRNFPGLEVTFSVPVRQANGNIVPAGVNLAPLFNVAGSELDANGRIRVTADWVVGTALLVPADEKTVTITAKVTDTLGRTGVTRNVVTISQSQSGQNLTPNPQ